MADFKLIYFEGCPNVEKAKRLLFDLNYQFVSVRHDALPIQHPLRSYSSPTLLEGDKIIFGAQMGSEGGGCSLDIPSLDELKKRLSGSSDLKNKKVGITLATWAGSIGSGLTVVLCPICIPSLGAFLAAVGLGFLVRETILKPLLIAFLILSLFGFFWSYLKEHKKIWPFMVGTLMAVGLYTSRYVYISRVMNQILQYVSIVGLIAISFWNVKMRRNNTCGVCLSSEDEQQKREMK